jgi:outer membrane protein
MIMYDAPLLENLSRPMIMYDAPPLENRRAMPALAALVWVLIWAGTARADIVRLQELEAQALRARPSLAANDARVLQAKARIDQARSAYAPTITLTGDASIAPGHQLISIRDAVSQQEILVAGSLPLGNSGAFTPLARYGGMLDVRGNLYDFGRTGAAVDAAAAQRRAAQAEANQASRAVVRDVRLAYVRWATADALSAIAREAAQAAAERSASTAASIEEGARPTADRIAAQSDWGFARLELERATATLETARLDLGFVCVSDLSPDARPEPGVLDGDVANAPDVPKRAGAPALHSSQHDPALTSLEEQRSAARASARMHDHAFAPVLGAQAQAGVQGSGTLQGAGTHVFPVYRLGINLTVPLWDGGADSAARNQAEARAAELAAQTADYTQQRDHALARTQAAQAQAQRRIALAAELVELAHTRLAQLEEGYPLGAATLKDLADGRAAEQRAKTELVLAQAMRAEARLGVE